jgi:hypothetical protein
VAPLGVAGHDVTGAARNAYFLKGIDYSDSELFDAPELPGRKIIRVCNGIVLVGAQGLVATSFTAKHKVGGPGREANILGILKDTDQTKGHGIVDAGDELYDVSSSGPGTDGMIDCVEQNVTDLFQCSYGISSCNLLIEITEVMATGFPAWHERVLVMLV